MKLTNRKKLFCTIFCILIILFSTFLNLMGSALAEHITILMYLDSILTMAVTAACGLIPGLICACLTNLFLTFIYKTAITFVICHICTVIFSWLIFKNETKKLNLKDISLEAFLWAGLCSALSNAIIGNIIADMVYSSNTGRSQLDISVQGLYLIFGNKTVATYLNGIVTNLVDKLLSAIISFFFYQIFTGIKDRLKLD